MGNQQPRLVLSMKKIILNGKESNYTITEEGRVFNLRTVSKIFDSLEDAFGKYAKQIKNNPELHYQIIDDIKWGIENGYNFTTLDRFIVDRAYESLHAMRLGEGININLEATELV